MADPVEFALRFLHITSGIAWIGGVFFSVAVLARVLPRVEMPARKQVMLRFLPIALRYVPLTAVLTIGFGATLYLYMGRFDGVILLQTPWGRTIFAALLLTLAMFTFGMTVVLAAGAKILRHLREDACTHQAEMGKLQKRFARGQPVVLVLGLIIIGLMVAASRGVF